MCYNNQPSIPCLFTTKISISERWRGRKISILIVYCGKQMVWPLYLYFPPRACLTCKIGLTWEMGISSSWVSMENTLGWASWSILFHLENRQPLISLWHRWQLSLVEEWWVTISGYDSIQVVHVCMMDKAWIRLRKFWVACVWSWCWILHIGNLVRDCCLLLFGISLCLFSPYFYSTYISLCSFCWSLDVDVIVVSVSFSFIHLSFYLFIVVAWTIWRWLLYFFFLSDSHCEDDIFSRPTRMFC